jgi:hypothetical protein
MRHSLPKLHSLPATFPEEGAVRIELEEGVPVFRASHFVQTRIRDLMLKERDEGLTAPEKEELDRYEEIDDYLSFINRVIRNLIQSRPDRETSVQSPQDIP